jgi:hypothetical protein
LLQEQVVNDEALLTFMLETEQILNDRPLVRQETIQMTWILSHLTSYFYFGQTILFL